MSKSIRALAGAGSMALAATAVSTGVASAANTAFDQFTPLASSAGPTAPALSPPTFHWGCAYRPARCGALVAS